ncbi:hypothetical protein LCGC14_0896140 [marine sediment metagenome]|uniref:Uncharacterized protein n=1 Tax=marine sediment metagenome TaxID=412755 RepID=A0A0F9RH10_9ZZZZ
MSKKLKAAMMAGTVSIRSKQSGEVSVWYRDREGKRQTVVIGGFTTIELAPKLTDAALLQWSNLSDLVKTSIEIL